MGYPMIMKAARLFIVSILLLPIAFALYAKEVQLTLDPHHSYILWHVEHLGFSSQTGKWYVNGTLTLDQEKPENSKVNVTVKIADIVTGIPELDKHLLGPLF